MVIAALGFEPENFPESLGAQGLELNPRGAIRVSERCRTALPGVYAAATPCAAPLWLSGPFATVSMLLKPSMPI